MLLAQIVACVEVLQGAIRDLEKTLQVLRGAQWREGIEKDERLSVSFLHKELLSLEHKVVRIQNLHVVLDRENDNFLSNLVTDLKVGHTWPKQRG